MKIIEGNKGLILCMPSRKLPNGNYKDVAHPITMDFRKFLENEIMKAYKVEEKKGKPDSGGGQPEN